MKISTIRKYLLNDTELKSLLNNQNAIYLVEKSSEEDYSPYIVTFYKPLNGGIIKDYQVEFRVIGDDLSQLILIQDRLIKLLDDPQNRIIIKDENTTIRHSKLLNGGGFAKNPDTGNFEMIVYFLFKI
jgi:hypothetical protein